MTSLCSQQRRALVFAPVVSHSAPWKLNQSSVLCLVVGELNETRTNLPDSGGTGGLICPIVGNWRTNLPDSPIVGNWRTNLPDSPIVGELED